MNLSVSVMSIVSMSCTALAGIIIPVILFLFIRKNTDAKALSFFIGCGVFILFALVLEGTINYFIFTSDFGKKIMADIWMYGILGGLMAGLFEEAGRFTAFKTVLKKYRDNNSNALMYGAGHGGFEAFYILVFGMVSNIVMSVMINAGMQDKLTSGIADEMKVQALNTAFETLKAINPGIFLLAIVERVAAVALHISLSVIVWFAAKKGGVNLMLLPLAVLLHAFVNAAAVIMSKHTEHTWLVLAAVYVMSGCCAVIAYRIWKDNDKKGPINEM